MLAAGTILPARRRGLAAAVWRLRPHHMSETHHLGVIVRTEPLPQRFSSTAKARYVPVAQLPLAMVDELRDANRALRLYRGRLEFLDLVQWNLEEYLALEERLLIHGLGPGENKLRSPELDLNRCLMNLLASARSYLDHTETDLKRRFGESDERYQRFRHLTNRLYDSYFAYRFLYRFRNFVQHCGLPLDSFSYESCSTKRSLICTVSRERLLAGFDWGALRPEIESLPEKVELTEWLVAYVHYLSSLHRHICKEELPAVKNAVSLLLAADQQLGNLAGMPVVFSVSAAPETEKSLSGGGDVHIEQFLLEVELARALAVQLPNEAETLAPN